jgi:type IV pilus assembly protein PilX
MSTHSLKIQQFQHQHGAVLIIALVMLVLVILLGTSLAGMALMDERAARNVRDRSVALQAAESALADAEMDIQHSTHSSSRSHIFSADSAEGFVPGCATGNNNLYQGLCDNILGQLPAWQTSDLANTSNTAASVEYGRFTGQKMPYGAGLFSITPPRYLIELMLDNTPGQTTNGKYLYRITAIGFGSHIDTQVVVQSFYRKV